MFGQDDELRVRFSAYRQGYFACQPEARSAVRDPDQVITEAIPRKPLTINCASEVVRRIGMRMIDMRKRQKPM